MNDSSKDCKRIKVDDVEEGLTILWAYNRTGENICTEIYGVPFFSDEYDKNIRITVYSAVQDKIAEKYSKLGREILDEKYWREWDRYVSNFARIGHSELHFNNILEVVNALKTSSFEQAERTALLQKRGGFYKEDVVLEACRLCDQGKSFNDFYYRFEPTHKPDKDYKIIDGFYGDIDRAVEILQRYKKADSKACIIFNGIPLYSDTVTLDNAYLAITGETKTEKYINLGHEILDEKYWEKWDKLVPTSITGVYKGEELDYGLEVIKALKTSSVANVKRNVFDKQNDYGNIVLILAREFSDKGESFFKYVQGEHATKKDEVER